MKKVFLLLHCRFLHQGHPRPYNFTTVLLTPFLNSSNARLAELEALSLADKPFGSSKVKASLDLVHHDSRIEVTLGGLSANTRYALLVKAFNAKGAGPPSPAVTVTTNEDSEL